jgi:hypothetical protein
LLAQGRWFSPGTPASSTTKTGSNDIAEILLKVALKRQKINKQKTLYHWLIRSADDGSFKTLTPENIISPRPVVSVSKRRCHGKLK